uniref:Translin associated factor X interacting protein 1 n=1 Tax=Coturnix japonica TaxID=93934 RepID=A0A8C2TL71_COTJA
MGAALPDGKRSPTRRLRPAARRRWDYTSRRAPRARPRPLPRRAARWETCPCPAGLSGAAPRLELQLPECTAATRRSGAAERPPHRCRCPPAASAHGPVYAARSDGRTVLFGRHRSDSGRLTEPTYRRAGTGQRWGRCGRRTASGAPRAAIAAGGGLTDCVASLGIFRPHLGSVVFAVLFNPNSFSLKPFQPSARGYWSTWPAYAAGQTVLRNHKPCSALLAIPKPQHLEQLESYLRKELQTLDPTKGISQEVKLQPYREIFEFFIDNFKTYKPLLSAIKKEYEATLAHQEEMIRALEPLKVMVATVSEECTQQILALQEKEKVEINTLKQEKLHLLKLIDSMKEENCSLQTQVNKRLQMSVAEEYTRYLEECSARKLLLAKLNERQNEQPEVKQEQVQEVDKGEDVVMLTLALKMARQDLTKAQVELNAMIAEYGDVVPRRDFESLEKKYSDLLQETETLRKDFDQLHEEYGTLLEVHRETAEDRGGSHTPRPNWAKCSVIRGGEERWGRLAKGKSSNQLVDVLLEEIGTRVLKEMNAFHGWVRACFHLCLFPLRLIGSKYPSRRWENCLREQSSLPEFFLSYLQKKYGDASAVEWSYTLYEYMRLCPSNHVMSSFYEILTGKVAEEQYHNQNQLISDLQKELAACDSSSNGSLPSEQFRQEPNDLKAAFCRIDPEINDQTLDAYISLAYQVREEQSDQEAVPVDTVLERLRVGDVRRVRPSTRKGSTTDLEGD